jgi:hypothetical protein
VDSFKLSQRKIQPGHIRRFIRSEDAFAEVAREFDGKDGLQVRFKPISLLGFYEDPTGEQKSLGLVPEAEICHTPSGRVLFFEVKNQGPRGNAEERAYRHHTAEFQDRLRKKFRLSYHPYFTIFTGNLASDRRYTMKIPYHIDAEHYFLWRDFDTDQGLTSLRTFLDGVIKKYLLCQPPVVNKDIESTD